MYFKLCCVLNVKLNVSWKTQDRATPLYRPQLHPPIVAVIEGFLCTECNPRGGCLPKIMSIFKVQQTIIQLDDSEDNLMFSVQLGQLGALVILRMKWQTYWVVNETTSFIQDWRLSCYLKVTTAKTKFSHNSTENVSSIIVGSSMAQRWWWRGGEGGGCTCIPR